MLFNCSPVNKILLKEKERGKTVKIILIKEKNVNYITFYIMNNNMRISIQTILKYTSNIPFIFFLLF